MRRKSDSGEKLYTTGEVAELLGIPASTQKEWDRRGYLLPAKRQGKHRRFDITDLKRMLQVQVLTERYRFRQRVLDAIAAGEAANVELPPALGGKPKQPEYNSEREHLLDLAARNAELFAEQRKLAKDLAVAEARYRRLIEQAPSGIIILDPESLIVLDANSAALELYGYTKDEIIGLKMEELVAPEDIGPLVRSRARIATGERVGFELMNLDSRGRPFPVSSSIHQIDVGGTEVWNVILHDISARKEAERQIRDSERKLRSIIEGSNDGIVLIGEDGTVLEWNRGQEAITGVPRDEALGRPAWELHFQMTPSHRRTPERRQMIRTLLEQAIKDGESPWFDRPIDAEVERADGSRRYIQDMMYSIPTSRGYMTCSISRDITAQRVAQESLRRSEERFRAVFESAPVGMALVGSAGEILKTNQALQAMLGYSADELQSRDVWSLAEPEDCKIDRELSHQLLSGQREHYEIEKCYLRGDGTRMWGRLTVYLISSSEDRSHMMIGMLQDITEQKLAQAELDRVRRGLERTVKERTSELNSANERLTSGLAESAELREALILSDARYRSLYEAVEAGILLVGPDGQVVDANHRAERILGARLADMKRMDPSEPGWRVIRSDGTLLPPGEHPTSISLRTGKKIIGELVGIAGRQGDVKWLIVNSVPMFEEESNTVIGVVATFFDMRQSTHMQ